MTREHYESKEAVQTANGWYSLYKERSFLGYLFSSESIQKRGLLLEVGGGSGIHGIILSQSMNWLYVHSDYSYAMCHAAREKGLVTMQSNGLALPIHDESVDEIFTVGVSTIVESAAIRMEQFREFYRLLKPGGDLIMVTGLPTPKSEQHCIDRRDVEGLLSLGFTDPRVRLWGVIPGRWWSARSCQRFERIEKTLSAVGLGTRKIVTVKKCDHATKNSSTHSK